MCYDGILEYGAWNERKQDVGIKQGFTSMFVLVPDIPDDEAQYWTGKLERINTMRIDDEVKCDSTGFYYFCLCKGIWVHICY